MPDLDRTVLYLDETMTDSHGEYSPVAVTENEPGYYQTTIAYGTDFDLAKTLVAEHNATRGFTADDVARIVGSSIAAQNAA